MVKLAPYKTACVIVAAVLLLSVVGILTKPSMDTLTQGLSQALVETAGDKYSETTFDYLIFNIARGKHVRTGESDTLIGFAGKVFTVNEGFGSDMADILFWLPPLMAGARVTISLTMVAVLAGLFGSVFLALGKMSRLKPLRLLCSAYIFFFRGTPLLMQLFFIYYGLPQISPALTINNKFLAAFIAFGLNSAAYCSEIIRAALQSIDKGQFEASHALGLSYGQTMRLVIIPQSVRRLIPPVANEFIMVLKDASLVSIIALSDLTHTTRSISSSSSTVLVYIPAMLIYLLITALFTLVFEKLEKRFSIYH